MALGNNDVVITDPTGTSKGYVLAPDNTFGSPITHTKASTDINIPFIGHQFYVPSSGERNLSFTNWSLGAGQESYDAEDASPDMFLDSVGCDISVAGELKLSKGLTTASGKPTTAAGKMFTACGYFWWYGTASAALKTSPDGVTWTDVTGGTSVGVVSGWATDGTSVWVCSKDDNTNAIYVCTYSSGWSAAQYGTASTDEKVHDIAHNGGYLFAAVEDSAGKMRVALVDGTTGAAAVAATNLTSPVMLGATATVSLLSCGNAVYWVTALGNQTTIYEVTYDPDSNAVFTEQYMECPTDFICTCAIGYLSTIYLGGYYWSTTSGVGQGAVYFVSDGWASPLFEIGKKPEDTAVPSDPSNDNIVRDLCDGAKDLYVITNRGVYRWDIDSAGYSNTINFDTITGTVPPAWEASGFTASSYPGTNTFFPSGWTSTEALTETKATDVLRLTGAATASSEGYITSAFTTAAGATLDITIDNQLYAGLTSSNSIGTMYAYLRDGASETKLSVIGTKAYLNDSANYVTISARTTIRIVMSGSSSYLYVDGCPAPSIVQPVTTTSANEIRIKFLGNFGVVGWNWCKTAVLTNTRSLPTVYSVAYNKGVLLACYKLLTTAPSTYTYYTIVMNPSAYQTSGWLQSSSTSMKSGSIQKFFRCIDVAHDPFEKSAYIGMEAIIDGQTYTLSPTVVTSRSTRFVLNASGNTCAYRIKLYAGTSAKSTPVIHTVSFTYDFKKYTVNSYVFQCAAGAKNGTWTGDVQAAITFLFDCADQRCTFEDRFNGTYSGSIYAVEFLEANYSVSEGYSGVVRLQVKEED